MRHTPTVCSRRRFLQRCAVTAAGFSLPLLESFAYGADEPHIIGSANAGEPRVIGSGNAGPDIHAGATPAPIPKGPFRPDWESLRQNYRAPDWFSSGKFGIFIHWGLYAVPAYHNEWYAKHMYGAFSDWHTRHYGPPDTFGYKDFIPLFKAEKYDPDGWANLFKRAGARYVVPVAEHHDGFAMWDSDLTRWCAGKMGPKRDLIGDLARSVRKEGLIFGLSSHRMEHHTFMYPRAGLKTDLFDPRYADFYGPPVPGNMNDGSASPAFQDDWLAVNGEAIYDSIPWSTFGDGDFRFTTRRDVLYAISMGRPPEHATIAALTTGRAASGKIARVSLLGSGEALTFSQEVSGAENHCPRRGRKRLRL